jgi:Ribosomal protein L4/L1 family
MSVTVLTIAAAKEANIEVIENGRGTQAVHDVVVAMRANRRSGSANTKTKAEVVYSGKNHGAKKVPAVRVRGMPHQLSGLGVVWFLVRNHGITRRRYRRMLSGSLC